MVKALEDIIAKSSSIVFFGGAGVSTESGIPDFRSVDGLYHQKYDYPPETILSHTFWEENPEEFYRFYRDKLIVKGAKPNAAHSAAGKAGAGGQAESHRHPEHRWPASGGRLQDRLRAPRQHPAQLLREVRHVLRCELHCQQHRRAPAAPKCGGIVKPDVVLYEEGLDEEVLSGAVSAIRKADTLIIGGTSLVVYPAAGLIRYFRGRHLVVINMQPTGADAQADLCIAKPIGQVLSEDISLD